MCEKSRKKRDENKTRFPLSWSKCSPEFCCHPVIRGPIIAGLECQGHFPGVRWSAGDSDSEFRKLRERKHLSLKLLFFTEFWFVFTLLNC